MHNCLLCGRALKPASRHLRRKVRTGEWLRRKNKDSPPTSVNVHFGMRVVCPWCAKRIDRENARKELLQYAELGVALLALLLVVLARFL
ncbi:hypothetical protein BH11ARM2_BH11ARM2_28840 [soil metagenome]